MVNLRDFGQGKHRTVDDRPYGGGVGMVLRVDVLTQAIESTKKKSGREAVILLDPKGKQYKQEDVEFYSKYDHLILVCGHYEGFDERIRKIVDFELSIGDYILSGGEIPAMVVVESIARLIPGVFEKEEASYYESFSKIDGKRILEEPIYTRPAVYKGDSVPKELLSGDPKSISKYRKKEALNLTKKRRPNILKKP